MPFAPARQLCDGSNRLVGVRSFTDEVLAAGRCPACGDPLVLRPQRGVKGPKKQAQVPSHLSTGMNKKHARVTEIIPGIPAIMAATIRREDDEPTWREWR